MTGFVFSNDHPSFSVENQLKEDWGDWGDWGGRRYSARQGCCCSSDWGGREAGQRIGQIWEFLKNRKYTNFAIIRIWGVREGLLGMTPETRSLTWC